MTIRQQRACKTLYEPKYGKPIKIIIWNNRDFDSPGQELTLHPKYMKSWNCVLNFLTATLKPRFGAVRRLYHLNTRKQVCSLQNINSDEKYVAVGGEKFKFKKNGYLTSKEKMLQHITKKCSTGWDHAQHLQNVKSLEDFMTMTRKKKRTVLYLMVNGRSRQMPIKVVLIERDLLNYNMILDYLAYRLDVSEGIEYLCNIKGRPVSSPSKLKHGQLYIAVPYCSKFIKLDYIKFFREMMPEKLRELKETNGTTTASCMKKKKQKKISVHVEAEDKDTDNKIVNILGPTCVGKQCVDAECQLYSQEILKKSLPCYEPGEYDASFPDFGKPDSKDDVKDVAVERVEVTTFADIARKRGEVASTFSFDEREPSERSQSLVSVISKKSVSFYKSHVPKELIIKLLESEATISNNNSTLENISVCKFENSSTETFISPNSESSFENETKSNENTFSKNTNSRKITLWENVSVPSGLDETSSFHENKSCEFSQKISEQKYEKNKIDINNISVKRAKICLSSINLSNDLEHQHQSPLKINKGSAHKMAQKIQVFKRRTNNQLWRLIINLFRIIISL